MLLNQMLPGVPLYELRREMDRLMDGWFGGPAASVRKNVFPALNVWEGQDTLYAEAEIPGVSMNELEIYVVGNELTVKGQRKAPEEKDVVVHRQERAVGEFSRTITLPVDIDAEKVEATLRDGVLTLTLPKSQAARPKKISIKTE